MWMKRSLTYRYVCSQSKKYSDYWQTLGLKIGGHGISFNCLISLFYVGAFFALIRLGVAPVMLYFSHKKTSSVRTAKQFNLGS